ncbi:oxygenase MpaB family protein [Ilumatobacter nonamiensis]|uniref:oxygenase MpaB family protein n=1 Tax=Ilumatobacter nonamiensis TaxID=467093 RepID=UPI00058EEB59|nr:oxygenase MpaB family protein [Ilumatobacter nonamiensis]
MTMQVYDDVVTSQRDALPTIYGDVDFTIIPERYDRDASIDDERFVKNHAAIARVIDQTELRETIRDATMTGDRVADAYAALIPELGFRTLIEMVESACEHGVENVDNAPQELVDLIAAMEATPDWVDMELVELGAREERIGMATATPLAIRGAFLATFLNKYAALPMTMTGTLSDEAAAKRVFETASFFTATTLPGALDRSGKGFEAAAKVRLMHSMVRFHLLRSGEWDVGTYGIPIPQVDQMPAGLIGVFLMSAQLLGKGETEFTPEQRARVELSRYRCFLLGLPENLLGETPQEIVDLLTARHISLREGYDDDTCGKLVRGTLEAELFDTSTVQGRVHAWLENGFSRFVLIKSFLGGDSERAESIGITFGAADKAAAAAAIAVVTAKTAFYRVGLRLPAVSDRVDRRLDNRLAHLLDIYGHADFVTDPDKYALTPAA